MNKQVFKSIGAFLGGFLTVFILSVVTDYILETTGVFPPQTKAGEYTTWMLLTALLYRSAYTVLGGYITARLAPSNPSRHVMVLGIVGTTLAVLGAIAGWNLSAHWYPIALAVSAYPLVWLGGKIKK